MYMQFMERFLFVVVARSMKSFCWQSLKNKIFVHIHLVLSTTKDTAWRQDFGKHTFCCHHCQIGCKFSNLNMYISHSSQNHLEIAMHFLSWVNNIMLSYLFKKKLFCSLSVKISICIFNFFLSTTLKPT